MSDATKPAPPPLPDRLSVDPDSPHHVAAVVEHAIGIRFNGNERFDVGMQVSADDRGRKSRRGGFEVPVGGGVHGSSR